MERLEVSPGAQLHWVQPRRLERSFELRSGRARVGTLDFRSSLGTLATETTAEGQWTFKRVGFLNPRVTVRAASGAENLAVYEPRLWGGGVLVRTHGPSFSWAPVNFWSTEWVFSIPRGTEVLRFRRGCSESGLTGIFKTEARVECAETEAAGSLLPVLLGLGLYLILLHQQDGAAVAAVTATIS